MISFKKTNRTLVIGREYIQWKSKRERIVQTHLIVQ